MRKFLYPIVLTLYVVAGCNKDDVVTTADDDTTPDGCRPITAQSSPFQSKVFEYLPAPGQFINETVTGGFSGSETTMSAATVYAEQRLYEHKFVSLGAFGGYIIVGFDHSIINSKGSYDFAIQGNAFETSNEPGIVWVMKDENRNGLPDDCWYELKGCQTGASSTSQNYSVTYFRPSEPKKPVEWIDSEGNSGVVDYLPAFHKQDYYYPAWIDTDSYTLTGTRLMAKNSQDTATGNWVNAPYDWGYVDNFGSDAIAENEQWVGFKISNAVNSEGKAVVLDYIDFIKVQTAVMAKSGWLGENSCEVLSFADFSMYFK